jgi:hypothetical protein
MSNTETEFVSSAVLNFYYLPYFTRNFVMFFHYLLYFINAFSLLFILGIQSFLAGNRVAHAN